MPNSPEQKKRATNRLRRIRGQTDALARAIEDGATCDSVLQQIAALRGAVNGLMADVLESHLREGVFAQAAGTGGKVAELDTAIELIRRYLK